MRDSCGTTIYNNKIGPVVLSWINNTETPESRNSPKGEKLSTSPNKREEIKPGSSEIL